MAQYSKLTNKQLIALIIEKDAKLMDLNTRLEKLEAKLSVESTFADRIITLERSSYRQAQYSRRDSVEIVGLPDSIKDHTSLEKKVVEVFNHAGVKVTERDFHAIHRLKKNSVIIAKCVNRRDATAILRAKRKLRDTDEATKKKLGVSGKIYVNESLCPEYRRLFGICNALYKKKLLSSSYTINGKILVVKEGEEEKMNIGHICDLEAMFDEEVLNNIMEEHKVKK